MQMTRAQSRQALRELCRQLKMLYGALDRSAAVAIQAHADNGRPASCTVGCAACCHISVVASKAEALVIADHLHRLPDWREWPARLAAAAKPYCDPAYNRDWYANQRLPCLFLDDERKCKIYEVRPSACRYYYVFTPAKQCGDRIHRHVGMFDMTEIEMRVLAFSNSALGNYNASCLPLIVLESMIDVGRTCGRERLAIRVTEGLPAPMKWMVDCIGREDGDPTQAAAVRKAWAKLRDLGIPGTQ